MNFLPVFLRLAETPCLVVGGGSVAARKIRMLQRAGARVKVVAPEVNAALRRQAETGAIELCERKFVDKDIAGCRLIIAATNDVAVNQTIARAAETAGIIVNCVDQPADSSAIMPSIIDRSPVVIAIGTGGNAPILARMLRAKLETMIPAAYGTLAQALGRQRERIKHKIPNPEKRRRFWEGMLDGPVAELFFAGRDNEAMAAIDTALGTKESSHEISGEVFLIGTGPGDPDLLTFRALRLMQRADVIVYDRLVGPSIVDLCRRDAERIYVGKEKDRHAVPQENINDLLRRLASQGQRVARLKGGDPFMFGRGGEEIETLAAAGIQFQIVPGITAALGCASYAGIPLTHRDHAHSCLFLTGHQRDGGLDWNWELVRQPHQTLAIYMGRSNIDSLCATLVKHGVPAERPAALIMRATLADQQVITATVASLAAASAEVSGAGPGLIIVGDVVHLREQLDWFAGAASQPPASGI